MFRRSGIRFADKDMRKNGIYGVFHSRGDPIWMESAVGSESPQRRVLVARLDLKHERPCAHRSDSPMVAKTFDDKLSETSRKTRGSRPVGPPRINSLNEPRPGPQRGYFGSTATTTGNPGLLRLIKRRNSWICPCSNFVSQSPQKFRVKSATDTD
jgi:hypothetical protein